MGKEVNKSFVFFESWYDVLETEKPEIQWEVIHGIMEYVFRGNLVELKPQAGMAFKFIKRDIDRTIENRNDKTEKSRENGKKGGNPNFKKGQSNPYYNKGKDNLNITEDNQTLSKINYNVNVNDNVNVDIISPHTPQGDLLGDFQETDTKDESSKTKSQEPKENPDLKTEKEKSQTDNTGGTGDSEKIDFERLLIAINEITGRDFRIINEAVKRKFRARLKEGYTKEDIFNTIKNAVLDKYHNETGRKYLTPEYFSRPQTIDKYRDVAKIKQKPKSAPPKRETGDL